MPIFTILTVILSFALLAFNPHSAEAQTMSNDKFMLQLKDLGSGKQEADGGELGTNAQEDLNQKQEPTIKANKNTLAFSISETLIYFGPLSPTNPILRSNKLGISDDSLNGYSVLAFQDKELSWPTGAEALEFPELASQSATVIPDVTCDSGLCSEIRSAPWTNTLTYGFGLRCDNILQSGCLADSSDPDSYRQFANVSKNETPQVIISGTNDDQESTYQITYKLNIAGTQTIGAYGNSITFIAVPNF